MKKEIVNKKTIMAIIILALFNFAFLGTEYLFDNVMACVTDSKNVVLSQSYILGASVIGFVLFPVISRVLEETENYMIYFVIAVICIVGIFIIQQHMSYVSILMAGCIVFILLGIMGSAVCYIISCTFCKSIHLAKIVGIAYAVGIFFQFINNNLVKSDALEAVVLSVCLAVFVILAVKMNDYNTCENDGQKNVKNSEKLLYRNSVIAGVALVITVVLMSCIFASLDNAVTLVHAQGKADIGQWPRLLLALSGLSAGFLFDIKERRYMNVIMYCVTLLSTVCVAVIECGGPFVIGLIVFYLSAGFFVVFFTVGFMDLSHCMNTPKLWAGLGRAVNNGCAVVTGALSVTLLQSQSDMAKIIMALILFALISICIFIYSNQFRFETYLEDKGEEKRAELKFLQFSEEYLLTEREREVLKVLLVSDDNIQDIAEQLFVSRAALYRHIGSLNEKTETKSRIGLLQFYYGWDKSEQ